MSHCKEQSFFEPPPRRLALQVPVVRQPFLGAADMSQVVCVP